MISLPALARRLAPETAVWAAVTAYGLVMSAIEVAVAFGGGPWPIDVFEFLRTWLLLPVMPLLTIALARRSRWATAALVLPTIAFALAFSPLFLPQLPPPPGRSLRVMTYNVHDTGVSPERLVAMVLEVDADIVGLQELNAMQADALRAALLDEYPFQAALGQGENGKGLLARFPISAAELFTLHAADRQHLRAVVSIDGTPTRVIVAHPYAPADVPGFWGDPRFSYYPVLFEEIPALGALAMSGGPALLIGDMNFSDGTQLYRSLAKSGLGDAFLEAGWGLGRTWPVNLGVPGPPFVRLDFVWHTDDFAVAGARVGPDAGSDHLPVVADLVLRGSQMKSSRGP